MQIADWLSAAQADVVKRQLPELVPLLEGLAVSTTALRQADQTERGRTAPARRAEAGDR